MRLNALNVFVADGVREKTEMSGTTSTRIVVQMHPRSYEREGGAGAKKREIYELVNHEGLCTLLTQEDIVDKMRRLQALRETWFAEVKAHKRLKIGLYFMLAVVAVGASVYLIRSGIIGGFYAIMVGLVVFRIVDLLHSRYCFHVSRTRWNTNSLLRPKVNALFKPWAAIGISIVWHPQFGEPGGELKKPETLTITLPGNNVVATRAISVAVPVTAAPVVVEAQPKSAAESLMELKELLNAGLITQEIFERRRDSIVEKV